MQEEACRHTLSALHTMLRNEVHRALFGAHSTIVCLTESVAFLDHKEQLVGTEHFTHSPIRPGSAV